MADADLFLGIDLGTTNSVAAVFEGTKTSVVRNAAGSTLTPSVVRLDARGNAIVGAKAKRMLESDAANTVAEFKRLMGTVHTYPFPASQKTHMVEELSAHVLRSLRRDFQEQFGYEPMAAVVTVPALFEVPQAAATTRAAKLAGFERVELLQEPVASALAAGWSKASADGYWVVYDLGGGTFDVSLLEADGDFLRVVGHDGDNFLGGRDIDLAIVDWLLGSLREDTGLALARADAEIAPLVRKLKAAAEEAKHELSREREAAICVPDLVLPGGKTTSLDVELTRDRLASIALPNIDRTIDVCERLFARHQIPKDKVKRIVLVGGPTVMPVLRDRIAERLGVPIAQGYDPMTLVAEGAAIFASSAALVARRVGAAEVDNPIRLHFPTMTSDLMPSVLGRVPTPTEIAAIRLERDGFESESATIAADGTFSIKVELAARQTSTFRVVATTKNGDTVAVSPSEIRIAHGLSLSDPPLSRTIGVALADGRVKTYFEKGTPLPIKRTFMHRTVETVIAKSASSYLRIPIVQGEFQVAHLCRRIGELLIEGSRLGQSLAVGAEVELTLEVDRGGRLLARANIPSTNQTFEEVADLVIPEATPEKLRESLKALRDRMHEVRTRAARSEDDRHLASRLELELALIEADVDTATRGDRDAAQKAQRRLLDLDAQMADSEALQHWPVLSSEADDVLASVGDVVATYGTPEEQSLFERSRRDLLLAIEKRDAEGYERAMRIVRNVNSTAWTRDPQYWSFQFEHAASRMHEYTDLRRAEQLVQEGRDALRKSDQETLRRATKELWKLAPADVQARRKSFDSGVR